MDRGNETVWRERIISKMRAIDSSRVLAHYVASSWVHSSAMGTNLQKSMTNLTVNKEKSENFNVICEFKLEALYKSGGLSI